MFFSDIDDISYERLLTLNKDILQVCSTLMGIGENGHCFVD